ncbi:peptide deformylase [candidate division WOR-3 bacterium]|nr:peptide deformylase [candidate division WOR-3 bacterium]
MSKIRVYPDAILHERAKEVKDFSNIHHLIERMLKTMREEEGLGLAANQIGVASQVLVGRSDEEKGQIVLVNPIIVKADGEDVMGEGCLSVPIATVEIPRAEILVVRGFDADGKEVEYKVKGIIARMVQHEIDHLNGVLIIDYLSKVDLLKYQMEYGKKEEEEK